MGNIDGGNLKLFLYPFDFQLHALSELLVQGSQRFIHEQNRWVENQRPGQSDTLLLTAAELFGVAVGQLIQLHKFQSGLNLFPYCCRVGFSHF